MKRADALNQLDKVREVALRIKAMNVIEAECVCNCYYETAEAARERRADAATARRMDPRRRKQRRG